MADPNDEVQSGGQDPELEIRLLEARRAERKEAARLGLAAGAIGLGASVITGSFALASALLVGTALLSGVELLGAFSLVAVVVLVFLAFLFERVLTIRAEGSETRSLEIKAGEKAR
jgi:hypothetical protein